MAPLCFQINHPPTTAIYPLSLHDALPISAPPVRRPCRPVSSCATAPGATTPANTTIPDRKSTRLNSSHMSISYAVFCLKKKTAIFELHQRRGRNLVTHLDRHVFSCRLHTARVLAHGAIVFSD